MKTIFSLLICFCFSYGYAQQNKDNFLLEEGCYVRGYYPGNPEYGMFWFFKKDSTFINFFVHKNYQITYIRKGVWQYSGDSILSLKYIALKSSLLLQSKVEYHAETKGSPDSVYFSGSIKGIEFNLHGGCSLIFDNEKKEFTKFGLAIGYGFKSVRTYPNGNFEFAISKDTYFGTLGISYTPTYYPLTINTFPNNNYHSLVITVPKKDSTNNIDISSFNEGAERYKYKAINPLKRERLVYHENELGLSFITKNREFLLNILADSRKRQPSLTGPIDELIDFLKKE